MSKLKLSNKSLGLSSSFTSGVFYGANSALTKKWTGESGFTSGQTGISQGLARSSYHSSLRDAVALFFVILISYTIGHKTEFKPIQKLKTSKTARDIALIAIIGGAIAQFFFYLSLTYGDPNIVTVLSGTWVLFATILSKFIVRKKYSLVTWAGVSLVLLGGAYAALTNIFNNGIGKSSTDNLIAVILILITALAWGLQSVLVEKGLASKDVDLSCAETNFYRYSVGAAVLGVMTIVFAINGNFDLLASLGKMSLVGLVFLVLTGFNAAGTNFLLHFGYGKVGAVFSSIAQSCYLPFGILWAFIILGTQATTANIISSLIVAFGISTIAIGKNKKNNKSRGTIKIA